MLKHGPYPSSIFTREYILYIYLCSYYWWYFIDKCRIKHIGWQIISLAICHTLTVQLVSSTSIWIEFLESFVPILDSIWKNINEYFILKALLYTLFADHHKETIYIYRALYERVLKKKVNCCNEEHVPIKFSIQFQVLIIRFLWFQNYMLLHS